MRKAVLATVLVTIFLMIPIAESNPVDLPPNKVVSPRSYKIEVYRNTSLPIEAHFWLVYTKIIDMYYVLDGGSRTQLSFSNSQNSDCYVGRGLLENLTEGYHTLKVYAKDSSKKSLFADTTFLIDTNFSYPTLLLSPLNLTYHKTDVPLTFTINDTKWQVFYSLDNSSLTRIYDNTTMTGLNEGQHKIFASAWSFFDGIYAEQIANFTVDTTATPTPKPIEVNDDTALAAIIMAVLALSIALRSLAYLKKFRLNR